MSNTLMVRSSGAALHPGMVMTSTVTKTSYINTPPVVQLCIHQQDVPPAALAYLLFIAPAAIMPNGK